MADYPDISADGFSLHVGRYGVTLTLGLSQPPLADQSTDEQVIVGRIRLSPALAQAIAQGIIDMLAQQANVQQEPKAKH